MHEPIPCCVEGSDLCNAQGALRSDQKGLTHAAVLTNTQAAALHDGSNPAAGGQIIGDPATSGFTFARHADGSALSINSLLLGFNDFEYNGHKRKNGSATLAGDVTAAAVPGDPNAFAIPAGAARFSVLGFDEAGAPFSIGATNSTPLTISELDNWRGPRVTGTLTGSAGGQTVVADLRAQFAWENRPPVAIATASNVDFRSSQMEPCKSNPNDPLCRHVDCDGVPWVGLKHVTVPVRLDASASYDPDPFDSLVYSWSLKVNNGTQPVAIAELPPGRWGATLLVQDVYGATSVARVSFQVRDLDTHPDICFVGPRIPRELKPRQYGQMVSDPGRFLPIDAFDYSRSAVSVAITKNDRKTLRDILGPPRGLGGTGRVLGAAAQPNLGVPGARQTPVPDPFAAACANAGTSTGAALVCVGYCGNNRCDPGEACSSCPADCGPCTRCGDARCDAGAGETCSTCRSDCGDCNPCGDGRCELTETPSNCAADCYCGDGLCEREETTASCAGDCYCGNSTCDAGETGAACANDCRCGDGICDASESYASCSMDCTCGNGICDPAETSAACPGDCVCGDDICDASENNASCPADCVCGDGTCDGTAGETCSSCAADCGACPVVCGDGTCNGAGGETCANCAADCGACPPVCGNGSCEGGGGETCANCAVDCGVCPPVCGDGVCDVSEQCVAPFCEEPAHVNGCCCADCTCGNTCPSACWGSTPQTSACRIL